MMTFTAQHFTFIEAEYDFGFYYYAYREACGEVKDVA